MNEYLHLKYLKLSISWGVNFGAPFICANQYFFGNFVAFSYLHHQSKNHYICGWFVLVFCLLWMHLFLKFLRLRSSEFKINLTLNLFFFLHSAEEHTFRCDWNRKIYSPKWFQCFLRKIVCFGMCILLNPQVQVQSVSKNIYGNWIDNEKMQTCKKTASTTKIKCEKPLNEIYVNLWLTMSNCC